VRFRRCAFLRIPGFRAGILRAFSRGFSPAPPAPFPAFSGAAASVAAALPAAVPPCPQAERPAAIMKAAIIAADLPNLIIKVLIPGIGFPQ